jgi:hypothetical protein
MFDLCNEQCMRHDYTKDCVLGSPEPDFVIMGCFGVLAHHVSAIFVATSARLVTLCHGYGNTGHITTLTPWNMQIATRTEESTHKLSGMCAP